MVNAPSFSFGTDFHGNLESIGRFLQVSKEAKVDHVVFGGDIAPKKMAMHLKDGTGLPVDEALERTMGGTGFTAASNSAPQSLR